MTTEKQPVTQAMGVTGLRIWSGVLAEEYLTAWSGTRKNKIIIEMQDDPVIATLLSALTMPLIAAEFTTAPADLDNERDVEASDFLWQCMNDMTQYSWRQHVLDKLTMMAWGWSAEEIVMKKRMGTDGNPPSQYNDGLLGIDILDPRGQETLERWEMSKERKGDVDAMVQRDPSTGNIYTIDEWKLVHATYRSRKRSPEGKSPLRELYKPWYMRKNIEIVEMIGTERDLAGLPLIKLPTGATEDDKAKAELIVRNARQDEEAGIVLPAPPVGAEHGWEFELIASKGAKQFRVREIIRDLNKIILMRFFAQFLLLGMEKTGTQALVQGSQDFFSLALESIQQELLETWQQQLVPFIFKLNPFPGITGLPTIEWGKPGKADVESSSKLIMDLVGVNVITAGPELEDYVRAMGGLPDRPEGVGEEPRDIPASASPFFKAEYEWEQTASGELIGTPKKAQSRQSDVALQYSQPDVGDVHIPSADWKKKRKALEDKQDWEDDNFNEYVRVDTSCLVALLLEGASANDVLESLGIEHSGFSACFVVASVCKESDRGEELRKAWNEKMGQPDADGLVDPSSMTIEMKARFAQVAGTTGRRARGNIEKATNDYQGKLVRAYDRWVVDTRKAIVKAEKAGKHGIDMEAVVDEELAKLADTMKDLGREGILKAVSIGLGDLTPDADAFKVVAEKVEENEKYIDESLIPDIKAKLTAHLQEETETYQLDELALGGVLTGMRSRAGGYSGAFWEVVFLGAGLSRKKDDDKRSDEGDKPRRVRWVLDPNAKHCEDSLGFFGCVGLQGTYESWDAMPTVPAGQTSCRGNCRCNIEVETSPGNWERVA